MAARLGTLIDRLHRHRTERLALQKKLDALKGKEQDLTAKVLAACKRAGVEKASGQSATFSYSTVTVPRVTDWDAFYKHIQKTGHFDLLQRRVADANYREHLEAKEKIKGVTPEHVVKTYLWRL